MPSCRRDAFAPAQDQSLDNSGAPVQYWPAVSRWRPRDGREDMWCESWKHL